MTKGQTDSDKWRDKERKMTKGETETVTKRETVTKGQTERGSDRHSMAQIYMEREILLL